MVYWSIAQWNKLNGTDVFFCFIILLSSYITDLVELMNVGTVCIRRSAGSMLFVDPPDPLLSKRVITCVHMFPLSLIVASTMWLSSAIDASDGVPKVGSVVLGGYHFSAILYGHC